MDIARSGVQMLGDISSRALERVAGTLTRALTGVGIGTTVVPITSSALGRISWSLLGD